MHRFYDPNQTLLFPENVRDYLGESHEATLIHEAVKAVTQSDVAAASKFHVGGRTEGRPAFDPIMMLSLLCYAYATGVRSSRKIARLPVRDIGAYWLTAGERPNFRTVCLFRTQNKEALEDLFTRVLVLAESLGLLKLGVLTLDGTKIRADTESAMCNDARLAERIKIYRKKVKDIVKEVETNDSDDDGLFGTDGDGGELDEDMADKQKRQNRLRAVASALRAQGYRKKARQLDAATETLDRLTRARKIAKTQGIAKASSTDPDSRFMKGDGGRILPSYNAQAIVEEGSKIIIGATVIQDANDSYAAKPPLDDAVRIAGKDRLAGREILADNGYFAGANFAAFEAASLQFLVRPDGEGNRGFTKEAGEKAEDRIKRSQFKFHERATPQESFYTCPRGRRLRFKGQEWLDSSTKKTRKGARTKGWKYRSTNCKGCPLAARCLQKDRRPRTILRDPVADPHKDRLREMFQLESVRKRYTIRMYTVEPVFGDIKDRRGMRRFALRGLEKVNIEWRWACLTHNLLTVARRAAAARAIRPVAPLFRAP